ncbi:MAG: shikimate kinase [Hyphomicrobiaceae bacterium]
MIRTGPRRPDAANAEAAARIRAALGARSIVMVGLMGCGKSSVGRRLAARLELNFIDADDEIEASADKTIPEIFADHGEAYFRDGERRVIRRLLEGGPRVLATGGGAYMNAETRENIRRAGIAVWLRAELPVLMRRVMRRDNRPLIKTGNPEETMRNLMAVRYPVYAEADLVVESRDVQHDVIVNEIIQELAGHPVLLDGVRPAAGTTAAT